ncbi:P-loop containing nucleoside triphosphate hydrolase protein [Cokeromyces recurvatus]|uniref:P-loop containing nucleoside triphosphate hydrolase protein n=1 Tax=Cokeromyces recurvatus TaxID=90255 RepID=UPI00222054E3|nr:P-loop containing nucleoside triphosphate hydrolase protein [Cokeromyces recurvatus]KAI7903630.1 P-loop containing nucleoside triphosphate hydrolase protein [Cokeromyces recurvatus]
MLRNILAPSTLKIRSFHTLTRSVTRTSSVRLPLTCKQVIRPRIVNDLKISPYAFLHTKSPALGASVAELVEETVYDDSITKIEPVSEQKKKFSDIEFIQQNTRNAIKRIFKYEEMSVVQEAVLSKLPNKNDMFVKAKTGTGKTLAFLIAAIETAVAGQTPKDLRFFNGTSIMIISPTRELANQITEEAEKLLRFYPFRVHCLVGGDSKRRQMMKLERERCDVVVATPGRLQDMLSSVPSFNKMCENLKVLILDEADQLLDMGFKAELQRILNQIPSERQTMLFSATISREIRDNLGKFALSPNYDLIDTVGKDDVNTHEHVKQSAIVAPYQQQFALIRDYLENYEAAKKGKVIVFLPTTKSTIVYSSIFKQLLPNRMIYEIHSKKDQNQRSRIAERFRRSHDSSILFTSDISARGVDYPGVSLVVQIGVPSSREQYIHRLGRTGRAGREGEGIIMLAPFEEVFLKNEISDFPIQRLDVSDSLTEEKIEDTNQSVSRAIRSLDEDLVRELYTAYLGYYSGRIGTLGLRRSKVVPEANNLFTSLGIQETPHLSNKFLAQLGLLDNGKSNERSYDRNRFDRNRYDRNNRFDRNDRFNRNDRFDRNDRFERNNRFDKDSFDKSRGDRDRSDGFQNKYQFSNDRRAKSFERGDNDRRRSYRDDKDSFPRKRTYDRRDKISSRNPFFKRNE